LKNLPGFKDGFRRIHKQQLGINSRAAFQDERVGILGKNGGFLPLDVVRKNKDLFADDSFFDFINTEEDIFTASPSFGAVMQDVCDKSPFSVHTRCLTNNIWRSSASEWWLDMETTNVETVEKTVGPYESVVVAVHDTKLAAKTIQNALESERPDGELRSNFETPLRELIIKLHALKRYPLYSLMVAHDNNLADKASIEFDSCAVNASSVLQWIRYCQSHNSQLNLWTAVSTVGFAQKMIAEGDNKELVKDTMFEEFSRYLTNMQLDISDPVFVGTQRWGQGLTLEPLGLEEQCLTFEPWGLSICGDYIGKAANAEAALLSGMQTADRILAWVHQPQNK